MAILGFPLIIPQLIMLMRISNSVFSQNGPAIGSTVILLAITNLLIIVLSIILFPFLWKD
jgi:heme exporter protein B